MKDTRKTPKVASKPENRPEIVMETRAEHADDFPDLEIAPAKGKRPLLLLPVQQGEGTKEVLITDSLSTPFKNKEGIADELRFSEMSAFSETHSGRFFYQPLVCPFAFAIRFLHNDKIFLVPRLDTAAEDCRKLYGQIRRELGEAVSEKYW